MRSFIAARIASSSRRHFPKASNLRRPRRRPRCRAIPKELPAVSEHGYYGRFGGMYIPEILVATFEELLEAFAHARRDPAFWQEHVELMRTYSCPRTPPQCAAHLTRPLGGARMHLTPADLNHTG